ncbi:MAG: elongation factor G [Dehalococcoidia bacterium]|nr:MAG: elongation factor G [Dehalococcoidia bacterium]
MESYLPDKLRNVAVLGHYGTGKTTLSEVMAFRSGAIKRLGTVVDGTSVSDYDPSEIERHMSLNLALLPLEWKGHKLNVLDTPGYIDFAGEVKAALRVCDAALLVVCASSSVEVGTEQVWSYARESNLPALVVINKMDRENADFSKTLGDIQSKLSNRCVATQMPIGSQADFRGYIDLVTMRAYIQDAEQDIPAELKDEALSLRDKLVEVVVEVDDDLMNRYLEGVELSTAEVAGAVRLATAKGVAVPVVVVSALKGIGVDTVMDTICASLPSPVEQQAVGVEVVASSSGPALALVFKTTADPFTGKISYFRVYSGEIASNSQVVNVNKGTTERIGQLFLPLGKQQITVSKVTAGDIGAIAKLGVTATGDTLGEKGQEALPGIVSPKATYSMAVHPESKGDLDKMSTVLPRMIEEDPSLLLKRDADTGENLLSGVGDTHLEVVKDKMSRKFGVKVVLSSPAVPYKETITIPTKAEHRHKKQTGGHGQYGHVLLELQPLPKGGGFEYETKVVGGSIPSNFLPSVEKGVNEARHDGVLAGFPLVDVKVILYDGSFHPVDSSDIAFKIAAAQALKKGLQQGQPVLLEPIMNLTVRVPEGMTGDVISDLNTKRGRVQGMNPEGGFNVISAQAPYSELLRYAIDLRSMLQGRGDFDMEFSHYEEVPAHMSQKIIARHQAEKAE